MRKLFGCILVIGAFFQPGTPAASVSVCDDASLRAAIAQGGIVTFGCSGTIVLTQAITISTNVVLSGVGAAVVLSGDDKTRLFNVSPGVEFQIEDLKLTRGLAQYGGAISNDGGRLVLNGATVVSNNATPMTPGSALLVGPAAGGGIYSHSGTVTAIACTFSSNVVYARNGFAPVVARGGAICAESGFVQVTDCLFESNGAEGGPGDNSSPGFSAARGTDAAGAAIYSDGIASMQRCRLLQNRASGGPGSGGDPFFSPSRAGFTGGYADGGVIHNAGTLQLNQCTFMNNTATGGPGGPGAGVISQFAEAGGSGGYGGLAHGVVIFVAGSVAVANSTFSSNTGTGGGGGSPGNGVSGGAGGSGGWGGSALGILFTTNSASAYLTNCTIVSNSLAGGDAQSGAPGSSCVVSGCTGGSGGNGGDGGMAAAAGVYFLGGTGAIVHCTFEGNSVRGGTRGFGGAGGQGRIPGGPGPAGLNGRAGATLGGAVSVASANVLAANSIFSHSQGSTNCFGQVSDLAVNISSDNSACFTNPASLKNLDAGLAPLADNGGPTMTLALTAASLAHDRGSNTFASLTDQRGVPRPQGKLCDVGAYEIGHLAIEKSGGAALIKYGAPPAGFYRLQGRANNSSNWRELGGTTAESDGYAHYGPLAPTNRLEIFRTVTP